MSETSVLVIDDEEDMRDMLQFGLKQRGYRVQTAESGQQALELAQQQPFDLVITDLRMPGMDGVATVAALKALLPGLRVVLSSGFATAEVVEACLECGASDYIRKPFGLVELEELLRSVLDK